MTKPATIRKPTGWLNLVVDYGPVLMFFLIYKHFSPRGDANPVSEVLAVIKGTIGFMIAAVAALVVSYWKLGRISPMLGLSTALIMVFGGLTVLLHDAFWIQIKPTVIYLIFGISLLIGWLRGKSLLKYLLEAAFEGLDESGWLLLSRNWGWFFLFLAVLNEVFRHFYNLENHKFDMWIASKIYVFMPISFLFTFAHMPMLLRHGLAGAAAEEVATNPPHE